METLRLADDQQLKRHRPRPAGWCWLFSAWLTVGVATSTLAMTNSPAVSPNLLPCSTFQRCTNPGIPDGWTAGTDPVYGVQVPYRYEDWGLRRFGVETGSPIPGTRCLRIHGDFYVTDYVRLRTNANVVTFSAYMRAARDGLVAALHIGKKSRAVTLTTRWQRHSFTASPTLLRYPGNCESVGWRGAANGTIWVAGPQLEYASPQPAGADPAPQIPPTPYRPSDEPHYLDENDVQQQRYREAPEPPEARCPVLAPPPLLTRPPADRAWSRALRLGGFRDNRTGRRSRQSPLVHLGRDDHQLYVRFTVPAALAAPATSTVGVILKPVLTAREYFDFSIQQDGQTRAAKGLAGGWSPLGQRYELRGWQTNWFAHWQGRAVAAGAGWTAEFAIPLAAVELSQDRDTWGMNLYWKNAAGQTLAWSPTYGELHPGNLNLTRFHYGRLHGLRGMTAPTVHRGLYRITDIGLECQPDQTVGVIATVERQLQLDMPAPPLELTLQLVRRGTATNAPITLALPASANETRHVARAATGAPWTNDVHRVITALRAPGNALVVDDTDREITITDAYNARAARLQVRVQLSRYTDERAANILVTTTDPAIAAVRVTAEAAGQVWPLATAPVLAPTPHYLAADISALPIGRYRLVARGLTADECVRALAFDTLVKTAPAPRGALVNRVTGCFQLGNDWAILRSGLTYPNPPVPARVSAPPAMGFNATILSLRATQPPEQDAPAVAARQRAMLDDLQQLGLGVIPWFTGTDAERLATIQRLQDHPAILYWYLLDEPGEGDARLTALYAAAKAADPSRPAMVNWAGWQRGVGGPGTFAATDIGSSDLYPFGANGKWTILWDYPLDHLTTVFQAMWDDCREQGLPLAFWHGIYGGGDSYREPTPTELRSMVYLGLIYGQRALAYWWFKPMYNPLWEQIGALHREISGFEPWLAHPAARPVFVGPRDGVHWAVWRSPRGLLLLAGNSTPFPQRATLPLASLTAITPRQAQVFVGRADAVTASAGQIRVALQPFEPVVCQIEEQAP